MVTTRRAALGDLANRTDRARGLIDVKKVANHNGAPENVLAPIDLKNVKPRVDTHWANQPARKPLSRSDSIKKPLVSGATASIHAGPKLVKAKSTETATVKEVKLIKKSESLEKQSTLKRQENTNSLLRRKVSATVTTSTATSNTRTSVQSHNSGKIIEKKLLAQSKSNELKIVTQESSTSTAKAGYIAEPPVIESRFPSYTNGLISDVSTHFLEWSFGYFLYVSIHGSYSLNKLKLTKETKITRYSFLNMLTIFIHIYSQWNVNMQSEVII